MNLLDCTHLYIIISAASLDVVMSTDSLAISTAVNFSTLYGDGYGTEWIYFPDGDGTPHNVSLTGTGDEIVSITRGSFNSIEYRLYTSNFQDSIILNEAAEPELELEDLGLFKLPLKIITHGWRSSVEQDAVAVIKEAYLKKEVNVITVDWSYIANSIFYHWVASQTESIGIEIAAFLKALSVRHCVTGDQIHLLGHSLGAHVMGIAAFYSNISIYRITGLDPARPLFEYPARDETLKLDASDASLVDIIHTCSGVLGIESSVGTADFFPNNGIPPQPGCETIPRILEACSHGRPFYYFAESIANPKAFPSYKCNSWVDFLKNRCDRNHTVFMGEEVGRDITGSMYLATNHKFPFGRTNE